MVRRISQFVGGEQLDDLQAPRVRAFTEFVESRHLEYNQYGGDVNSPLGRRPRLDSWGVWQRGPPIARGSASSPCTSESSPRCSQLPLLSRLPINAPDNTAERGVRCSDGYSLTGDAFLIVSGCVRTLLPFQHIMHVFSISTSELSVYSVRCASLRHLQSNPTLHRPLW